MSILQILTWPDPNTQIVTDITYHEVIGSLQYAATGTHPDIAYTVSLLSHFLDRPEQRHWITAKHVLRYLASTIDAGIIFNGSHGFCVLTGYSDADFASCEAMSNSRSHLVMCCMLWKLGFTQDAATAIHCDNHAAMELLKDSKYHSQAKHIDIKFHHVHDRVATNEIMVPHC